MFLNLYFRCRSLSLDFSCLNCDDTKKKRKRKKITTAIFKRQSSSVGWKLRKIICFVGKYKENFLPLRKLLLISSREELREISLPFNIGTLTFMLNCQLLCYLYDWILTDPAQDYRNFSICLKTEMFIHSVFHFRLWTASWVEISSRHISRASVEFIAMQIMFTPDFYESYLNNLR